MKRVLIPAILAILPTACGGGGGSSSAAAPAAPPPAMPTIAAQRAMVAEVLSPLAISNSVNTTFGTAARARAFVKSTGTQRTYGLTWSSCADGFEYAQNQISAAETQYGERAFYDVNCAHLQQDSEFDIIVTNSQEMTATGSTTFYDQAGNITAYDTLKIVTDDPTSGPRSFTFELTAAPSPTAPQTWAVSLSCSADAQSTVAPCGYASVAHEASLNEDLGVAVSLTVSQSTSSSFPSMKGTATPYTGALSALTLVQPNVPAWTISGGIPGASAAMTAQMAFDQNGAPSVGTSSTAVSNALGATASLSANASHISGTVTETSSGLTLATFTTDVQGNGTIRYSDGTQGTISSWMVLN